jgi:transposase InsO family protein
MLTLIQAIHAELKGAYGSKRMVKELRNRGYSAGKERVERLMREHGIRARHKRRYKATTGLEARPAGGGEPAGPGLHADGAESGLDL